MAYAQSQLFYRCFSTTSASELKSGRYYNGHPALSTTEPLNEFHKHRRRENTQPTALVSVTNHPVEAVHRALAKHYWFGEDPGTIWVVIIRVPGIQKHKGLHHAKKLAQESQLKDVDIFKNEYLFEWEIPLEYEKHRISAQTLLDQGIEGLLGLQNCASDFPRFAYLRGTLVGSILESDPYGAGRWIASLAQAFDTSTCIYQLASQILRSLLSGGYVNEDHQFVRLYASDMSDILDFSAISVIELGIRDQLDSYFGI
ncbi:hypothetical protein BJX61DRAFT_364259 [Aspergillus egyptiacus]|nr:hypothetical protein BJX61DRAFT_364259 [Aspergillus egyptiacus]